jgi:hypothetical protein
VPHIVTILVFDGVLHTGGVAASNEMGDTASNAGGGVPEDLGGATVVHGGGPHGEDGVLRVEGTVVKEGLVLEHAGVERHVVVLAPSTEGVEEEDGVLVALLEELLTGVLEEEHVAVVEGVAHLEGVHGIGTTGLDLVGDLGGSVAVHVHAVIEGDTLGEVHGSTGDEPFTLGHDGLGTGVFGAESAEGARADLLLAVLEVDGLGHGSVDNTLVLDGELLGIAEGSLLSFSKVHGDWH